MFWDASAESLGIGTSSVVDKLQIQSNSAGTSPVLLSLVNDTAAANATGVKLWMSGRAASTTNRGAYLEAVTTNTNNAHDLLFATSSSGTAPAERMRIDSSGRVGIGTSSPSQMLELSANNGSGVANVLRFNDAATGVSAGQTTGRIEFAENDGGDTTVSAFLEVDTVGTSGGGVMAFGTGSAGATAAERMRIDASGNLLLGGTSPYAVDATTITQTGLVYSSRTSNLSGQFDRRTTDGEIMRFTKDGAPVGSIGSQSGHLYISGNGANSAGLRLQNNGIISPTTNAVVSGDTVDIGQAGARFKDLYLSGGVYLGGTGAANLLDYYEAGLFTPTVWRCDISRVCNTKW